MALCLYVRLHRPLYHRMTLLTAFRPLQQLCYHDSMTSHTQRAQSVVLPPPVGREMNLLLIVDAKKIHQITLREWVFVCEQSFLSEENETTQLKLCTNPETRISYIAHFALNE